MKRGNWGDIQDSFEIELQVYGCLWIDYELVFYY